MLINEIEVPGSSISFKCWALRLNDLTEVFKQITDNGGAFNLEAEVPGFHDCDSGSGVIRGYYSVVIPFEVEHLVDGLTTKTLFKRIESCEFLMNESIMFTMGKPGPMKLLGSALSAATGEHFAITDFSFAQLRQLQDRMTCLKSIVVLNPKEKEIKKARLSGQIEDYTEYNILDARNHDIDQLSGIIDTPLGPMTATVGRKGSLRLTVKKGLIIPISCLEFIMALITDEKGPGPVRSLSFE